MTELRDQVARELQSLLHRAGLDEPWADRPEASTRWRYSDGELYEPARLRLHDDLVRVRRGLEPAVSAGGRLGVVITAGPPGAGKSTVLARDPRLAGFRGIDADDFKDPLLLAAQADGLLHAWDGVRLKDGRPVALRELSGFVHAESTAVADAMRQACFADGENVIVHGTLSSTGYIRDLLEELDAYGYEDILIVDVEVPLDQAIEQALGRWWRARDDGTDPLGGRFIPAAAIRSYYPSGSATSVTRGNAEALRDQATAMGWRVELTVVDVAG